MTSSIRSPIKPWSNKKMGTTHFFDPIFKTRVMKNVLLEFIVNNL